MKNWWLMQTFYHGLTTSTRETMNATAGGAFLSLTIRDATALVEKMVSNQSMYRRPRSFPQRCPSGLPNFEFDRAGGALAMFVSSQPRTRGGCG
jgi:hypothetical protein